MKVEHSEDQNIFSRQAVQDILLEVLRSNSVNDGKASVNATQSLPSRARELLLNRTKSCEESLRKVFVASRGVIQKSVEFKDVFDESLINLNRRWTKGTVRKLRTAWYAYSIFSPI
eukprot:482718_1